MAQTGPTVPSGDAVGRKGKVVMSQAAGQLARVASVSTSTVTVDNLDIANLVGQYTSGEPGMLVIVDGQADSDDGKTANITAISGTDLTVDQDFSTGGALGADDIIAVVPPLAHELDPNGGVTLGPTVNKDDQIGLTSGLQGQDTMVGYNTDGEVPIFATIANGAIGRMLLMGIGAHKIVNTNEHQYVPAQVNDGTYTENDEGTIYVQDGNGVVRQAFLGLMATDTQIEVPRDGVASFSQTYQGTEAIREVGGTGKTFPSGSSNWERQNYPCQDGKRFAARGALVELGGTFGNGVDASSVDQFFQELTINITREPTDASPLGVSTRAKPEEDTHMLEITGTRLHQNDTVFADFYGGEPTPGDQTETRFVTRIVNPNDNTRFLEFDAPRGVFRVDDVQRQRGHLEESFTYRAIQTLDGDDCVDTANPLYRAHLANGDATDYAASLTKA